MQSGGERVRVREPGDGAPEPALPFPGHTGPAQTPPGTAAALSSRLLKRPSRKKIYSN